MWCSILFLFWFFNLSNYIILMYQFRQVKQSSIFNVPKKHMANKNWP
jgi:hypothetical protein